MEFVIGGFCLLGFVGVMVWVNHTFVNQIKKIKEAQPVVIPAPQVHVNLKSVEDMLSDLPNKVLQSITASANANKGALGELIGYIQLRSSYDRIVPLGNIVDFMCIKFPETSRTGEIINPGHVDFVDIKTGNRSRLSKDQRELQKLIDAGKINFIKLKVDTSNSENTSN